MLMLERLRRGGGAAGAGVSGPRLFCRKQDERFRWIQWGRDGERVLRHGGTSQQINKSGRCYFLYQCERVRCYVSPQNTLSFSFHIVSPPSRESLPRTIYDCLLVEYFITSSISPNYNSPNPVARPTEPSLPNLDSNNSSLLSPSSTLTAQWLSQLS